MGTIDILMFIALICIIWSIVALMLISSKVSRSGTKVHFFLITLLFFRYISVYEDLTKKETGKTGPLFYPCIASINIALVLAVVYFLT